MSGASCTRCPRIAAQLHGEQSNLAHLARRANDPRNAARREYFANAIADAKAHVADLRAELVAHKGAHGVTP